LRKANETEATATARVAILHDDLGLISSPPYQCYHKDSTYRFLNGTELFELGAESGVIRVPCQATGRLSVMESPQSMAEQTQ
jgi:hypothetical protein